MTNRFASAAMIGFPLMGWSGRAPAPPASEAGKGRQRQGAGHVADIQYRDRRDRHRYRQELVPRRGPRCARRHRAAAKVVAWPSGSAARQYTALPDRHGSLRRRTSPEPQTRIAWSRCKFAAQVMSADEGFHADQARRYIGEPRFHLATRPLLPEHDSAARIVAHDVK